MTEEQMRWLFDFEQGCRLTVDSTPGTRNCTVDIDATDTESALVGLGLLVIRLAEILQVPAEKVLAATAVTVMQIGEKLQEE